MKTVSTIFFLFLSFMTFAQDRNADPITWTFDTNQIGPDSYELIFIANYESPWVVYSMFTEPDGPIPTSITLTSKNVEKIGEAQEKGSRVEMEDKMFGVNVIKFKADEPYIIKQKVRVSDISESVTGYITFMTCDNHRCLPPKDVDFSFTYKVTTGHKLDNADNKQLKIKTAKKSF